jgi:hypothetical protein
MWAMVENAGSEDRRLIRSFDPRHQEMIYDVAAIIGGRVTGRATAAGFMVGGARVVLFERRDLAPDPNWGDVIHPHTRDVLTSWGALEAYASAGLRRSSPHAHERDRPLASMLRRFWRPASAVSSRPRLSSPLYPPWGLTGGAAGHRGGTTCFDGGGDRGQLQRLLLLEGQVGP